VTAEPYGDVRHVPVSIYGGMIAAMEIVERVRQKCIPWDIFAVFSAAISSEFQSEILSTYLVILYTHIILLSTVNWLNLYLKVIRIIAITPSNFSVLKNFDR